MRKLLGVMLLMAGLFCAGCGGEESTTEPVIHTPPAGGEPLMGPDGKPMAPAGAPGAPAGDAK